MQIAVGGCMAQKGPPPDPGNAPTGSTSCSGTHNLAFGTAVTRALTFRGPDRRGPGRPDHEVKSRHGPRALRVREARPSPGLDHVFRRGVITPAPTASCRRCAAKRSADRSTIWCSKPRCSPPPGQRDHVARPRTSTPTGETSPVDAPSSPISCARSGRVEGSSGSATRVPPPRPESRDDRGDGRNAGGLPAAASPAAVRLGPGVEGRCAEATRSIATWTGWLERAPPLTTSRSRRTCSWDFPGGEDARPMHSTCL